MLTSEINAHAAGHLATVFSPSLHTPLVHLQSETSFGHSLTTLSPSLHTPFLQEQSWARDFGAGHLAPFSSTQLPAAS